MYSLLILTRNQLKYARSKQGVGVGSRCLQEGIVRKVGIISTKLGTNHNWVNGIQICSNKGQSLSPGRINCEIVKKTWMTFLFVQMI